MPTEDKMDRLIRLSDRVQNILNETQKNIEAIRKEKPVVKRPVNQPKVAPAPRKSILVSGNHDDNSLAQPALRLKKLKENIRSQSHKPTAQQEHEYFELSEEIERRGDAYFSQLEELYNPKEKQNGYNKRKPKRPV